MLGIVNRPNHPTSRLDDVPGPRRNDIILATEFSGRTAPGPSLFGRSCIHLMDALEASSTGLRTNQLDLHQLENFDRLTPTNKDDVR